MFAARWSWLGIALLLLALPAGGRAEPAAPLRPDGPAGPAGCAEAAARLADQQFASAEDEARRCLEARPEDPAVWAQIARALGGQRRYDEALQWTDRLVDRFPDDLDHRLQRLHLLAWAGQLEQAWEGLQALPRAAFEQRDAALLRANVALWRGDSEAALAGYAQMLQRWPGDDEALRGRGLAHKARGERAGAAADFETLCERQAGDGEGCRLADELASERPRAMLWLQPSYILVQSRGDGWGLSGGGEVRVWDAIWLGGRAELRNRDLGDGLRRDALLELTGAYRPRTGFQLELAGGLTPDAQFSPVWSVQVQPGYAFDFGLVAQVKYWRLQFRAGGAHVVSPALTYHLGAWRFDLRYYLALDDDRGPGHSALGKIGVTLGESVTVTAGAAGGDRSDYIEPRGSEADAYWLVLGGLSWDLDWRHRLQADYLVRRESAGARTYLEQQFLLGYRLTL